MVGDVQNRGGDGNMAWRSKRKRLRLRQRCKEVGDHLLGYILADYGFIRQVMSNLMMINVSNHQPQLIQVGYHLEPERDRKREIGDQLLGKRGRKKQG